ncbi:MAG: hypothetical protein WBB74_04520 [Gaiellaceae bacterium]
MADDYRIRIDVDEAEHAAGLLERLGLDLDSDARELAKELEGHRLAVSRDGEELFVYAQSPEQAEQARAVVESMACEAGIDARISPVERWLPDEERWSGEPLEPGFDEETLGRGFAPWEVRVECSNHPEARELADRLEAEGYGVVRRFTYLIVGVATEEEARELARRLHGEVEPGGELVWEVSPQNPFAIFGGIGSTGAPF